MSGSLLFRPGHLSPVAGRRACAHEPLRSDPQPGADRCQVCGATFSLRACATCGFVGCCESQGGHARLHALANGHPVIRSLPLAVGFTWCYVCGDYTG